MEIVNSELDVMWLSPAQVNYVDSVGGEESDGGVIAPFGRQTRPVMQATLGTWDVAAVWAMFGTTRSGRKAFFIRPPVDRFKKVIGSTLGTATGAEQTFTLKISLGTLEWDADYVVEATLILYANGVAISSSDWTLDAPDVTLDADTGRIGQTITATFEYKRAVRFVEPVLEETILTVDHEEIQNFTVREIL